MLDANLKAQLQGHLQRISGPVEPGFAGDAATVPCKQIIIAMGEGAKAGLGDFDHLIRTPLPEAAARASIAA